MHIALIGGGGHVGRYAMTEFMKQYAVSKNGEQDRLDITLFSRHPNASKAFINELRESVSASPISRIQNPFGAVRVFETDQYESIRDADLVFLMSNTAPTPDLQAELAAQNIDPRTSLAYANKNPVIDIFQQLQLNAPDARIVTVTNQADMMARLARDFFPEEHVLGFGGMTDTYRFRMYLNDYLEVNRSIDGETKRAARIAIENCYIVGYHNDDMTLLPSDPNIPSVKSGVLDTALRETKIRGHKIAMMGRNADSDAAKPPYMLAGVGVALTMAAMSGRSEPIQASFNIRLDAKTAARYGVPAGTDLSVPITLGKSGYTPMSNLSVDESTKERIALAVGNMSESYNRFLNFEPSRPLQLGISPEPLQTRNVA